MKRFLGAHGTAILLMVTYAVSYMDRQAISILQEPIKHELHLTDSQLGLLTGLIFALSYSLIGIVIGQIADRWSRKYIIVISIVLWSLMTAVTGWASSFVFLLLARVGVAVGEAGIAPAGAALVADRYDERHRGAAISFFFIGAPFGILLGFLLGGELEPLFGWRTSFLLLGPPGFLVAALVMIFLKEPPRPAAAAPIRIRQGIQILWKYKTVRLIAVGLPISMLVTAAPVNWASSYLIRSHHMSIQQVGLALGLAFGVGGAIGTFGTGWVCDRLGARDWRWYLWLPAILTAFKAPFICAALLAPTGSLAILFLILPCAFSTAFGGAVLAVLQMMSPPQFRGTTTALYLLLTMLFGVGVGTWLVGYVSDLIHPAVGAASIKYALLIIVPGAAVLGAALFWAAARTLPEDHARAAEALLKAN